MWKLTIGAESVHDNGQSSSWLKSVNNHLGRQVWEFCPQLGSPDELLQLQNARLSFQAQRFDKKHSADLLMRFQVRPICEFYSKFGSLCQSLELFDCFDCEM